MKALAATGLAIGLIVIAPQAPAWAAPDCDGPPPAAQPSTPSWTRREADNVFCGAQRSLDAQSNPAYGAADGRSHAAPILLKR